MALEEQLMTASLADTFHEADKLLSELYKHLPNESVENSELSDEYRDLEDILASLVERAFRDVSILSERLALPILTSQIVKARSEIADIREIQMENESFLPYSPPLQIARNYFESLRVMTQGRDITGLGVFENVLKSAGNIVKSRRAVPTSETEVSEAIRQVLAFAFPGQVRTSTIEKTLKSYKPDIGVVTLMAAAETKFCTTRQEAKNAMDGIYADMKGYSGRDEWRSFYAVIYMTDTFFSQDDVDREFRLVKAEYSWTPYVVLGPGERKTKSIRKEA